VAGLVALLQRLQPPPSKGRLPWTGIPVASSGGSGNGAGQIGRPEANGRQTRMSRKGFGSRDSRDSLDDIMEVMVEEVEAESTQGGKAEGVQGGI